MSHEKILSKSTANRIKEKIISGDFSTGEQIPNEQELAEEFSVSRPTIREAVKILVSQNILEIRRGKGTYVRSEPGVSEDPFGFEFMQQKDFVYNLAEIRTILEPLAAGLAARRASDEEIAGLQSISDEIDRLISEVHDEQVSAESLEQMALLHIQFHTTLFKMSHNPVLDRMLPVLGLAQTESFSNEAFYENFRKKYKEGSHSDICNAIAGRDPKKAFRLREEQLLSSARDSYGEHIKDLLSIFDEKNK